MQRLDREQQQQGCEAAGAGISKRLREVEAVLLQHWLPEADTAHALLPRHSPADARLLRAWLLGHRAVTLFPVLADAERMRQLGQTAVNERNTLLLDLLLIEPRFSAQGG